MYEDLSLLRDMFPIIPQKRFKEAICDIYSGLFINKKPRVDAWYDAKDYKSLISEFSQIPLDTPLELKSRVKDLARRFFKGAVNWRSPLLQYNIGASVNIYASAAYAVTMDVNVYNINDGLAGDMLASERTVVEIMANLAGMDKEKSAGIFTFGGTATNLYALKLGLSKALPETRKNGVFGKKIKVFISEDAHFSHLRAADWLGIGTANVEVINSDIKSRESICEEAESKIGKAIEDGFVVPALIINGGTTYTQTIDNISKFVSLRDRLVEKYSLPYKPHVHVDSVIGWCWLVYNNYDFDKNELKIERETLERIEKQNMKISELKLADSWGVDFHKGIGGCPIDSSLFMINNVNDIFYLSRKLDPSVKIHQLAGEFSLFSPVDYTLETSRSGGASFSALTMFHTEGLNGLRSHLAQLTDSIRLLEIGLNNLKDVQVINSPANGFVVMVRVYPPSLDKKYLEEEMYFQGDDIKNKIGKINKYVRDFFAYDLNTRMRKNNSFEYSFSSECISTNSGLSLSALKFYPTSPHFSEKEVNLIVRTIKKQKVLFDKTYDSTNI